MYRDWCAWLTVLWAVISVATPASINASPSMPVWLDVLLATLVVTYLFGVLPAILRLWIRRMLWRRRRRTPPAGPTGVNGTGPVAGRHPAPPASRVPKTDDQQPRPSQSSTTRTTQTTQPPATDEALAASLVLTEARELQFPVARAVRALQLATDPKGQYEALLDVADALSVTLGTTVAAWLRHRGVGQEALGSLHEAYVTKGVSQGGWHQLLGQAIRVAGDDEEASPGLRSASQRTKGGTLLTHLGVLVQERNRWAHGARPRNSAEAARRVTELQPTLEAALSGSGFLADMPWVLTHSSSYQPLSGEFQVIAFRAMGDHPEFERQNLTSAMPLADDGFFVLGKQTPIELSPLVVMRYCETCHQQEVCYADRLDPKLGTSLKSFDRGHVIFDPTLDEEVQTLIEPRRPGQSAG
ncbi:MAG: hypothetical protein ACRDTE_00615 [Pseudonocardiaceae bacterium]